MSVYLVAQIQIENRDEYGRYESGFLQVFSKYSCEILAVDEAVQTLEGQWPFTRTVIIRFPDEEEAQRWYNSSEYQSIAQHRFRSAKTNVALVSGVELPRFGGLLSA